MFPSNTAFFCIPGGFCPGAYFHKVVDLLQAQGHEATALDLPSMDASLRDQGKMPGMYDDAVYVRSAVSKSMDKGKDVVLVASSYGGAVVFEACKGLMGEERGAGKKGGELKHLVLLGVLLCEPGITVKELVEVNVPMGEDLEPTPAPTHIPPMPASIAGPLLCGSLSEEEQEHYLGMAKPISVQAFVEPITYVGWKDVLSTLIIGEKDVILSPERQTEFFDEAMRNTGGKGLKKVVVQGGDHLTMLSHAEEVVGVCLGAI
jgi:pimeloyl-ACP methyl ester carboxylesterase